MSMRINKSNEVVHSPSIQSAPFKPTASKVIDTLSQRESTSSKGCLEKLKEFFSSIWNWVLKNICCRKSKENETSTSSAAESKTQSSKTEPSASVTKTSTKKEETKSENSKAQTASETQKDDKKEASSTTAAKTDKQAPDKPEIKSSASVSQSVASHRSLPITQDDASKKMNKNAEKAFKEHLKEQALFTDEDLLAIAKNCKPIEVIDFSKSKKEEKKLAATDSAAKDAKPSEDLANIVRGTKNQLSLVGPYGKPLKTTACTSHALYSTIALRKAFQENQKIDSALLDSILEEGCKRHNAALQKNKNKEGYYFKPTELSWDAFPELDIRGMSGKLGVLAEEDKIKYYNEVLDGLCQSNNSFESALIMKRNISCSIIARKLPDGSRQFYYFDSYEEQADGNSVAFLQSFSNKEEFVKFLLNRHSILEKRPMDDPGELRVLADFFLPAANSFYPIWVTFRN